MAAKKMVSKEKNPFARSIPSSLRPGPITRFTDRFVLAADRAEQRIEAAQVESYSERKEWRRLVLVFLGVSLVFSVFGDYAKTNFFFASAGLLAVAGKAWFGWRRLRSLPEALDSDRRRMVQAAAHALGWITAFLGFGYVTTKSMPLLWTTGYLGAFVAATVAAIAYRRDAARKRAYGPLVEALVLVAVLVMCALVYFGSGA